MENKTEIVVTQTSDFLATTKKAATFASMALRPSLVAETFISVAETLVAREIFEDSCHGKFQIGLVVYDRFQVWDIFGLLDIFGSLRDKVRINIIAEKRGVVESSAGAVLMVDYSFADAPDLDILILAGSGDEKKKEVNDMDFVTAFKILAIATPCVVAINTGAAVLARTGLLDGLRATVNTRAYDWVMAQSPKVSWEPEAKWVADGKYFTSAFSAGRDMSLALIAKLFGQETALNAAENIGYDWNKIKNN